MRRDRLPEGVLALLERAEPVLNGLRPLGRAAGRQVERTRHWPLAWGTFYVAVFCLISYWLIDRPLALYLKAHVQGDFAGFWRGITHVGRAEYFLVPAGLLWVGFMLASAKAATVEARERWRARVWAPAFLFLSIALSGLISNVMKFSIGRARPRNLFENGQYGVVPFNTEWAMNSFPSGHSQAIWAAMGAMILIFPRHVLLWVTVAVLVAASRVFITVHYLSDVVAGSWLAVAVTVLLARAMDRRGISPRWPG